MTVQDDAGDLDRPKPFIEHLEDLRKTILGCLGVFVVGMLVAIPVAPHVLRLLKAPVRQAGLDPEQFLRVFRVTSGFAVGMRIMLWTGLIFSVPAMIAVIAWFVFPGLKRIERRTVITALLLAAALFVVGVVACYFTTLPVALTWLLKFNKWMGVDCEFVDLNDYVSFALKLLLAFGVGCEFPVVVLVLGYLGIVRSDVLRSKRRHVIVVILFIAMVLTPPDPLSMMLMAIPMVVLQELCIWLIWARERARAVGTGRAP